MQKYSSVFMLYNRMMFWRSLLVFAGMGILEVFLLASACRVQEYYCSALGESGIDKVFLIALVLITAILCFPGGRQGKQIYTLWRLRISERGLFGCRMLVSLLYYFLLWAWQIGIVYAMGRYFMQIRGVDSPQSTVMAFYGDDFLHYLFPMEAYHIWAWNIVLLLGFLIFSAAFSFYWQRRKLYYPIIVFFFLIFLLDSDSILVIVGKSVVMLVLYVIALCAVWKRSDIRED